MKNQVISITNFEKILDKSKKKDGGLSESDIRSIMKEEHEQTEKEITSKNEAVLKRIDKAESNIYKKMQ